MNLYRTLLFRFWPFRRRLRYKIHMLAINELRGIVGDELFDPIIESLVQLLQMIRLDCTSPKILELEFLSGIWVRVSWDVSILRNQITFTILQFNRFPLNDPERP